MRGWPGLSPNAGATIASCSPEPRANVLNGIARHDDGWAARDAAPQITRQGKPSAFSVELVGKYSAFEEIDLADYLAVRDRAVRLIAAEDAYAAVLISMHTYSLLTDTPTARRSRRSSAAARPVSRRSRKTFQQSLREQIAADAQIHAGTDERSRDPRPFPSAAGHRQSFAAHLRGFPPRPLTCCILCRCATADTAVSK